jgi:hypothetical protein
MKTGIALVSIGVAFSLFAVWSIIDYNPDYWWLATLFIVVVVIGAWGKLRPDGNK